MNKMKKNMKKNLKEIKYNQNIKNKKIYLEKNQKLYKIVILVKKILNNHIVKVNQKVIQKVIIKVKYRVKNQNKNQNNKIVNKVKKNKKNNRKKKVKSMKSMVKKNMKNNLEMKYYNQLLHKTISFLIF